MEGLTYVLLYFLRGSLPWQGLQAANQKEKYHKICLKKQVRFDHRYRGAKYKAIVTAEQKYKAIEKVDLTVQISKRQMRARNNHLCNLAQRSTVLRLATFP
jgi:hypothetical protein